MKKIKDLKKSIALKMEKLSERELLFVTGGRSASSGSSGSGINDCDGTVVHCCLPSLPAKPASPALPARRV